MGARLQTNMGTTTKLLDNAIKLAFKEGCRLAIANNLSSNDFELRRKIYDSWILNIDDTLFTGQLLQLKPLGPIYMAYQHAVNVDLRNDKD